MGFGYRDCLFWGGFLGCFGILWVAWLMYTEDMEEAVRPVRRW